MEPEDFLELRKEVLKDQEEEKEELNAEENYNMRERIIAIRKKIFKSTEEKVQLRWKFEDAIKRPYFHMKPLERGQLVIYMPKRIGRVQLWGLGDLPKGDVTL